MHFGPDGYLYISVGDEGSQFDGFHNSQRIDKNFFSAILRIDVDKKPGSLPPNPHASVPTDTGVARYAIPPDNPWVGATSFNGLPVDPAAVRTEFYAVGLRNPWRFWFDPPTGELWEGDVGQDAWEEVNLIIKGGNYGWVHREGRSPGFRLPAPAGFSSLDPLYTYPHGTGDKEGNSVIGGLVYHGGNLPELQGAYVFGDNVSGHIWALRRDGGALKVERLTGEGGIASFGRDPSNEDILVVDINDNRLLRLERGMTSINFPGTLGSTGLFADLTDLAPSPGLIAYEPNVPFWSDHAKKRRWFRLPDATSKIEWSRDSVWKFPTGTIWVKHFDLELTRGDPATARRLETRVLVKTAAGAYGVSYRWNEAQTEATLVPDEGVSFDLPVVENGKPRPQTWQIPSRSGCMQCHTAAAGYALSFNTAQLNRASLLPGFPGNQIEVMQVGGCFASRRLPACFAPRL